jgi:hypothetical protein
MCCLVHKGIMCEKCDSVDARIDLYRKFLKQPYDAQTIEGIKETIQMLEQRKQGTGCQPPAVE